VLAFLTSDVPEIKFAFTLTITLYLKYAFGLDPEKLAILNSPVAVLNVKGINLPDKSVVPS
jgi:hypothetical protein